MSGRNDLALASIPSILARAIKTCNLTIMILETLATITTTGAAGLSAVNSGKEITSALRRLAQNDKISAKEVSHLAFELQSKLLEAHQSHLDIQQAILDARQALQLEERIKMVETAYGVLPQVCPRDGFDEEVYFACPKCLPDNPRAALVLTKEEAWCHNCKTGRHIVANPMQQPMSIQRL